MTITSNDLPAILAGHKLWLMDDPKGSRANLSGADLSGANLYGADLSRADLYGANLSGANLYGADLSRANLSGANLYGADLYGADLSRANLSRANLSGANLSGANLSTALNASVSLTRTRILPEGSIIGYKRCQYGIIVKLRIPEVAKRSSAFGRKCRAEYAEVVSIEESDGTAVAEATSSHDSCFKYHVGDTVRPEGAAFDPDWRNECAPGIHFFITREEAVAYGD